MLRHTLKTGVATAVLLSLAPAAFSQELVIGLRAGPDSIDPHWSTLGSQAEALRHIYDTLVDVDDTLQRKPGLADSLVHVVDTVWDFKVREVVEFHRGTPLTVVVVK